MLIIAHRGNNREAPENSREAFEKSVSSGAHRIEMDLQWTRDQKIVVFHDDSLRRITGLNERISGLSLEEINTKVSLPNGEPVPELGGILRDFLPRIELNLEIKGRPEESQLAKLVEMVSGCPGSEGVIFSAFHPEPLQILGRLAPQVHRAVLWGRDTLAINPVWKLKPEGFMEDCGCRIFHPEAGLTSARHMKMARDLDWKVFPWVPMAGEKSVAKREALWAKLRKLGVDGLCTNEPSALKAWLEKKRES